MQYRPNLVAVSRSSLDKFYTHANRSSLLKPGREQPPDSALNKLVISYPECSRFVPSRFVQDLEISGTRINGKQFISRAHHYFCICGRAWNDPIHGDPDAAWAMELNTISTADPMYGTLINGAQVHEDITLTMLTRWLVSLLALVCSSVSEYTRKESRANFR